MRINRYATIMATCLWATLSFSIDYERWESAIKNSDLTFFARQQNDEKISKTELMGLLVLANEIVQQRRTDIHDRNVKIYASMIAKIIPSAGIGQIMGFILDQRGLGAAVGVCSLFLGIVCSLGGWGYLMDQGAPDNYDLFGNPIYHKNHGQPLLAAACLTLGLTATAIIATGSVFLERWFWRKARAEHDKLEKIYHDAVAIKAYLTTLAANYR